MPGPDLQNVPSRSVKLRVSIQLRNEIRKHSKGLRQFLEMDTAELEQRLLAAQNWEKPCQDYWKQSASELFGVPVDQVTDEQRRIARILNLGKAYGHPDLKALLAQAIRPERKRKCSK